MLCSHVVLRQSLRRGHARLASTAAAEVRRPRGRPRKLPILLATVPAIDRQAGSAALAEPSSPPRRGRGRPKKAASGLPDGIVPATTVEKRSTRDAKSASASTTTVQTGKSDASQVSAETTKKATAKAVVKASTSNKTPAAKRARSAKRRPSLLMPKHHDLASFLDYAARVNLNKGSSVYRGHHYEYTAAETLKRYNFTLQKMGRANDLGIDLLGTWHLPTEPHELRVLIQCKNSKGRPAMVRELEGAYVGAPTGWRGNDVMALLITRDPATQGVRDALQRSRLPMGFAQITELGYMQQFMWNHAAQESRLTGMSVTNLYRKAAEGRMSPPADGRLPGAISLLWMGKQWSDNSPPSSMMGPLEDSQSEHRLAG